MLRHGGDGSVGRAAGGGDSSPVLQIEPLFVIGWLLPGEHDTGFFRRNPDTKQT